jgi:hypothetical protein
LAGRRGASITRLAREVGADRFEHDVEVAGHAEPRAQERNVKLMRTEIMEDRDTAVEQRLDVDELPRPVLFLEDTLANGESIRQDRFRATGEGQVLRAGAAKHSCSNRRYWRLSQPDQDLA